MKKLFKKILALLILISIFPQIARSDKGYLTVGSDGAITGAVQVLSTKTGINGQVVGTTNLYTVPSGDSATIVAANVCIDQVVGFSAVGALGIGIAAGESDIVPSTTLTGMNTANQCFQFSKNAALTRRAVAGDVIKLGIDTGYTATSATLSVDLLGYLKKDQAVNPTSVPELMAGGIWLPGVGVTSLGGGSSAWASQATQANPFIDTNAPSKPVATTANNGAAVWDVSSGVAGSQSCWSVMSPGTALQWNESGSYAVWAKGALTASQLYLMNQGPEGFGGSVATNNRFNIWYNPLDNTLNGAKFSSNVSFSGSLADDGNNPDRPGRAKANFGNGLSDPQVWHFYRLDYTASKSNYKSSVGANLSHRWEFYIDENWQEGDGFSAPPQNTNIYEEAKDYRDPVNGGPMQLFSPYFGLPTSSAPLTLGGQNYACVAQWPGQLGPMYISNGDVPSATWKRIMLYSAPRD